MHVRALPARGGARRPTHYRIGLAHRRTSSCAARPATASDSCSNNERTNAPSAVRRSAAIAPSTHAARVLTPDRCSGPPGPRGPYCSACLCGRQKIMQQTDNTTHTTLVTRWRRSPADVLNPSPGQRRLQRRWQRQQRQQQHEVGWRIPHRHCGWIEKSEFDAASSTPQQTEHRKAGATCTCQMRQQ